MVVETKSLGREGIGVRGLLDKSRSDPILSTVAKGPFPAVLVVLAAAVLVAGPGMALFAALPCNVGPPMACCDSADGERDSPSPCGCSLSPVAPSHTLVEGTSPVPALDAVPAPALIEPVPAPDLPAAAVASKARAAPLFVLFVAFLN